MLILLGSFLDMFDGLVARKLNVEGNFGAELDSLADMVNFGIAPAFLYWFHVLDQSWMDYLFIAFLPVMGAWRLAKFNIADESSYYFSGLAIPSAGLFVAFAVYAFTDHTGMAGILTNEWLKITLPVVIGILMVTPVQMFSLKGIRSKPRIEKFILAALVVIGALIFLMFQFSGIPLIVLSYILLSVLNSFIVKIGKQ